MSSDKIYRPGWRVRKAYWTATVVMSSYLWLYFKRRIFGKKYYEKRIFKLHVKNAERVKIAILELKGLFIKIGQLLSILSNFLPEAFQKPLEALQDNIPPQPYSEVEKRIEKEFGKKPHELFPHFEEVPLAAASIGQAHRARLPNGTEVVVKVQHANIEKVAEVDLRILKKLNGLVMRFFDIQGLDFAYEQVKQMIEEELDFSQEAQSMWVISKNLSEEPQFEIPKVHLVYSTSRVLTTTWHDGVKIANIEQLDQWQLDREDIIRRLLRAYSCMVFKDGFYHADPHPGNILVKKDGTIVLLDFGAVAPLSAELRSGIPKLIEATIKNDTKTMVKAMREMGFLADGKDAEAMAKKVIKALRNFLQNEVQLEGLNFKDIKVDPLDNSLFDLLSEVGIGGLTGAVQVPKDWVLLNRMATLLLGISNTLSPKLNPLEVVRPYIKEFVVGEKESLVNFVTGLLRRTVSTTLALPEELHRVLNLIEQGELETRTPDIREASKLGYMVGQQFLFTILAIASAGFGYLFFQAGEKEWAKWGFYISGFFILLFLRSLRAGNKMSKRIE